MQKSYIQVTYRDIAKMLSSALPVEGEEFGDKVEEYLETIKALPREAKLALFLKDISEAWKQADEQQQNRLAKQLSDTVWIRDKRVLAVTPRPEFKPFFDLQYEGLSQGVLHIRPRGDSNP